MSKTLNISDSPNLFRSIIHTAVFVLFFTVCFNWKNRKYQPMHTNPLEGSEHAASWHDDTRLGALYQKVCASWGRPQKAHLSQNTSLLLKSRGPGTSSLLDCLPVHHSLLKTKNSEKSFIEKISRNKFIPNYLK